MKYTQLFIFLFFIAFTANANKTVFSAGFEQEIEQEWASTLSSGLATFERNNTAKHNGEFGLQMKFSAASQKGNLTTATTIPFETGKQYEISFWYKAITPSDNSATNIKLFMADKTKIGQLNLSNWSSSEWAKYEGSFTAETTGDGYILFSFRPTNSGGGEYLLDDFLIEEVEVEADFFGDLKTKTVLSDTSILWKQFGPGMSGNNKSAFWHPSDSNVLFIGPNMGNSYVSFDKGVTYSTTLNEDESDFRKGPRGPIEYTCVDFSRQNPDFGFCTDERNSGIFFTENRGLTWTLAPTNTFDGLYVDAVAVDPKDDQIWYAGGGRLRNLGSNLYPNSKPLGILADSESLSKIWKSTDSGKTWVLKNSGLKAKTGIETLLVDPTNSDIVYASTSTGFYKSFNGGDTWIEKNDGLDYTMLRSLAKHYDADNDVLTLFVMSNPMWKADGQTITDDKGGIFKSTDRGETWTKLPGAAFDMTQFQSNTDIKKSYYHCAAYVFDMTDAEFEAAYPNLPSKITMRWNTLEVDPNDANTLFANNEYSNASRNNFKPGQVWKSIDGGQNWHVCFRNGTGWETGSSDYDFWNDRGNPMKTNIHLRYLDEWVNRDKYDRKGCNFVKFNSTGTVLHTQMAKISMFSYDKGETWVDIDDEYTDASHEHVVGAGNSNVPGHGFFQHPEIKNQVFCMAGENQLCITTNDGDKVRRGAQAVKPVRIVESETSLSAYAVDPIDTTKHYAMFFRQAKKGKLLRSTDNGETWEEHGTAIPSWDIATHSGDQSVHQIHLTIDPKNTDNMYFVVPQNSRNLEYVGNSVTAFGFHKSEDGGLTWKESNAGLPDSKDATMVAIDPNNSNILYVAIQHTDGGLFKSTHFGENWTEVASTSTISGNYGVNDIHFARDGKIYIAAGGKNGPINDGGIWVSDDNMESWTKIFDYPWPHRIETAYYNPKTILVSVLPATKIDGMNAGTYLSQDGGESWIKMNLGNGQSDRINDIAIDNHRPGRFYASTYGSGWYVSQIPNPNPSVAVEGVSFLMDTVKLVVAKDTLISPNFTPSYAYNQNVTWSIDNNEIASISSGKITGLKVGTTTARIASEDGSFQAEVLVIVGVNTNLPKIDEHSLQVYPNPTKDSFTLRISDQSLQLKNMRISIHSISGKKVIGSKSVNIKDIGHNATCIDLSALPNGPYILKVKSNGFKVRKKIMKY